MSILSRMLRQTIRNLFSLNEGPWRWGSGFEAGIAMGLPIALFTLAGNQFFGFIAVLGTLATLYCATLSRYERIRMIPLALIGIVVASSLGVFGSAYEWLTSIALVAIAALGCLLTLGTPLGSPGPTMVVLVGAISAHFATPLRNGGVGIEPLTVLALVAAGGLISYLAIIAPLAIPSVRRRVLAASKAGERPLLGIKFDSMAKSVAIRVILAVAIASLFNRSFGAYRSYWVIITAVAVLQGSHTWRLTTIRALHRILGTIIGVGVFALIVMSKPNAVALVAIVATLHFATEVVVYRNYGIALIFITPLALTIYMAGQPDDPFTMIRGRISDTLLGAGIALMVFWTLEWLRKLVRNGDQSINRSHFQIGF